MNNTRPLLSLRRDGRRWWALLSREGHIVGANTTWTLSGARRWARRRALRAPDYSGTPEIREEVSR